MKNPFQQLKPFGNEGNSNAFQVSARLTHQGSSIHLLYNLFGPLDGVRIPEMGPTQSQSSLKPLWETTCFEFFLRSENAPSYWEWNFSPTGEWRVMAFEDYRKPSKDPIQNPFPPIMIAHANPPDQFSFSATIFLPDPSLSQAKLAGNISVVLEHQDKGRSYWALDHKRDQPDFHYAQCFVPLSV